MSRSHLPSLFWIGIALLALGTGPLLSVILAAGLGLTADPNPNPIGLGILATLTFWPSVGAIIAGLILAVARRRTG